MGPVILKFYPINYLKSFVDVLCVTLAIIIGLQVFKWLESSICEDILAMAPSTLGPTK